MHRGLTATSPSMEYLERAFDDAKYGRTSEHPYAEVMFPTAHEPGLAPDGKHIMMAFTQYGPFELREGSWETERDAYAKRVIDEIARYAPGLPDAIEHIEVLTPEGPRGPVRPARRQHHAGRAHARSDVLVPPHPVLRRSSNARRGAVPLRGRHAPGRRRDGRARPQRVDRGAEGPQTRARSSAIRDVVTEPMTLAELAAAVRSGRVSAVELVEMSLERIERLNPSFNAVIQRARARRSTTRARSTRGSRRATIPDRSPVCRCW